MNTGDSPVVYAIWTQPGTSFQVEYSLPLFHEIDFFANEGFRRIPHGGIELGGLLFGRATAEGVRLEAFRPIECEHASGPSFKLSERDVAALRKQMEVPPGQAGLPGLQVAGWFIAHTRSELQMNEMEAVWFDDLLPGPGKVTVLVKPEKFKATRFALLMRGADGVVERGGADESFVLPLPGRGGRSEAIAPVVVPERSTPRREPVKASPPPVAVPPARVPPARVPAAPVPAGPVPAAPAPVPIAPVPVTPVSVEHKPIPVEQVSGPAAPVPAVPVPIAPAPVWPVAIPEPTQVAPRSLPLRRESVVPTAQESVVPATQESVGAAAVRVDRRQIERRQLARGVQPQAVKPKLQSAVFLLAGLLGCGIGYWTYLQLPAAVIPLNLQPEPEGLTLSWPAELTRDADDVAMRVNDGDAVAVSAKDKIAGRSEVVPGGDNVKVELIVRHWIRDSRGIVRFVGPGARSNPPP